MVRGQRSEENHRTGPLMTEWSRKVSPSLTSLISAATFGWWVRIWCERHENIDPFCLVSSAWSASGVIVVVVGEMSMSHFELLRTIWSLFSLPEFWWPDQTLPFLTTVDHLLMDTLQQDDSPGHKAPAISYWFLSVSVHWTLHCSPQSAVLSPGEPLGAGDVDVQLMNLQQIVTEQKPLRNVCRTLLDPQEQERRKFWGQKVQVQPGDVDQIVYNLNQTHSTDVSVTLAAKINLNNKNPHWWRQTLAIRLDSQ